MDERISDRECFECGEDVRTCACEKRCRDCGGLLSNPRRVTWMEFGPICRGCNDKRFKRAVDATAAGGMYL